MKVFISQKIKIVPTAVGSNIGGETDSANPSYIETGYIDNVTAIEETLDGSDEIYEITYTVNGVSTTTTVDRKHFIISAMGG